MKYLNALLKAEENPRYSWEEEPTKPMKPVLSVLSGAPDRGVRENEQSSDPSPWPCRHCGNPAVIEAVERSLDGTRVLTYWHCKPCQTWAVTPDTIRQPPVWVSMRAQ